MNSVRVLVVEDEPLVASLLRAVLEHGGFSAGFAGTAAEGIRQLEGAAYDVVLMDLGLPDGRGIGTIVDFRKHTSAPILIVSGQGAGRDRAEALDAGADDFIPKPFDPDELLARVRAAIRRPRPSEEPHELEIGDLALHLDEHRMTVRGEEVPLSQNEHRLLSLLAGSLDRVVASAELTTEIWGGTGRKQEQHLRVLIAYLRRKIELDPAQPEYLITHRGVGYRLRRPT